MEATQRTLIDLPERAIRALQLRAERSGMSLKRYMEVLLIQQSEEPLSDEQLYKSMLLMYPDGKEEASEEEVTEFRAWLKLSRSANEP